MVFKEIFCQDCNIVLAKYNVVYFSDSNIADLARLHYPLHAKNGHSLVIRLSDSERHTSVG
jgi:penicillin V acylase-like amidase (Ntn superfamily)